MQLMVKIVKSQYLDISTKMEKLVHYLKGCEACTASHYKFWKIFTNSGEEFGIVLEDDVKLSEDFKSLICDVNWIPKNTNIIKLEKFAANRPSQAITWTSNHNSVKKHQRKSGECILVILVLVLI